MDAKQLPGEGSEGSEGHGGENTNFLREYLHHWEQTVNRITDDKLGAAGEGSGGNEEHATGKFEGR